MIKVTDDYIIQVDPYNYTVCLNKPKKTIDKETGKESITYPAVGYCGSLENALLLIRGRLIRDELENGEYSLLEVVETVQKITADFKSIIEAAMKGETEE